MNNFLKLSLRILSGSIVAVAAPANAFIVTAFSPIGFSDQTAGIIGFTIEDFEDTELISGLSVEWSAPQIGPFTTLPSVINNSDFSFSPDSAWDGENYVGNADKILSTALADITTFNFANNPTSVGIGISNYQFNGASLLVNGNVQTGLSSLGPILGSGRNVYLRIDAEQGEVINSIGIDGVSGDVRVHRPGRPIPPINLRSLL
jgi:hypothetical protein